VERLDHSGPTVSQTVARMERDRPTHPAPHPASRHATARVLRATRWEFASSSRPDAAPASAPAKTRRDVPKSPR